MSAGLGNPWNGGPGIDQSSVAITGGNTPFIFSKSVLPVGVAPTGSMANNGAMTAGTAFNTIYANCYLLLPAGAIAAGVPAAADFYFVQMSSATVGTVFNNLMSANLDSKGAPTIPASPTAFVTTGPGAFTGVTTAATVLTLTLPGGTLGTKGILDFDALVATNTTAVNKVVTLTFGGTTLLNVNAGNTTNGNRVTAEIINRDSASVQSSVVFLNQNASNSQGGVAYSAINTGASANLVVQLTHATATDTVMLESFRAFVTTP